MAQDQMDYQRLVQDALRGVVRQVLDRASQPGGLPEPHHLFVTFATQYPGVILPQRLLDRYRDEMTIVLQTHYWDLVVHDDRFEVTLSFQQELERLTIPLKAIIQIFDPAAPFTWRFEPEALAEAPSEPEDPAEAQEAPEASSGENVVSLDAFRKR